MTERSSQPTELGVDDNVELPNEPPLDLHDLPSKEIPWGL